MTACEWHLNVLRKEAHRTPVINVRAHVMNSKIQAATAVTTTTIIISQQHSLQTNQNIYTITKVVVWK